MERSFALAMLAVLALAGTARADLVIPAPHKPTGPNTKIADHAVGAAIQVVQKRDRACRVRPPASAKTTHQPPPQDLLDAFAVLRRPATAQDALPVSPGFVPFGGPVAVDYVRRARTLPNGMAVYVLPLIATRRAIPTPPGRCFFNERLALEHRLRGKPAQAQRAARRLLRGYQRGRRAAAHLASRPGLFVLVRGASGGFGTTGDVTSIRERGTFLAMAVPRRHALVVSVVPDGVATIDFEFARGHSVDIRRGANRFYRHVYRRSVAVVHNVVALTVPRSPVDVFYHREVWRAADGSVVGIVEPPKAG
jgi:hypothetical protein